MLVVDLYTADVMEALAEFARLPRPGLRNLKVMLTRRLRDLYDRKGRGGFVERMARTCGVSVPALASRPGHWVVAVRRSLLADLEAKGVRPTADDAWSFSLWSGYLAGEDGQILQAWFDAAGCPAEHIHTSGHASARDLKRFAEALSPGRLIPVHGAPWDRNGADLPNLCHLADGQPLVL